MAASRLSWPRTAERESGTRPAELIMEEIGHQERLCWFGGGVMRRIIVGGLIGGLPGMLIAQVPVLLHQAGIITADQSQLGFVGVPCCSSACSPGPPSVPPRPTTSAR
jgi:hypothetical protein